VSDYKYYCLRKEKNDIIANLKAAEKSARYWQLEAAKLSVKQETYAELGRLFAKCSIECEKESCRIDICDIAEACQKRAELLVKVRK
jgi:hypothetical protein